MPSPKSPTPGRRKKAAQAAPAADRAPAAAGKVKVKPAKGGKTAQRAQPGVAATASASASSAAGNGVLHASMSDEQLIAALKGGDEAAFEELFTRHKAPLLTFLQRYTRDAQRAEDLFQQAFLRVYSYRDSFKGQSSFRTWLYSIAVNAARDLHRHERIRKAASLDAMGPTDADGNAQGHEPAADDPRPLDQLEDSELKATLEQAIDRLDEEYRAPFILARFHNLSYQEIADTLSITVPTVRMRVFRAHRKLAGLLAKYVQSESQA